MDRLGLLIFVITYAGVALGGFPGSALDRTGVALLGAIAVIAGRVLTPVAAVQAIDVSTILLLYGLMIVSAQLRLGGFYTRVALAITRYMAAPARFLLVLMAVSAGLSAVLANDIVCLAFTPVVTVSALQARLNPIPFLLGLAVASNIGSAATIIGNPQNMLIGQYADLKFGRFSLWCTPPSLAALGLAYWYIRRTYRTTLGNRLPGDPGELARDWPDFNAHQARKGVISVLVLLVLFFTPVPRELSTMAVAGALLCSRKMATRWILDFVDWHLITLFCGLFVVIRGLEVTGTPADLIHALQTHGVDVANPYVLTAGSAALSNVVSNVPATMLLVKFLDPRQPVPWYVLALASTFAGNFITIGSIANLIVFEQAKRYGVHISFREHARVGIPVTLLSLAITVVWIWLAG